MNAPEPRILLLKTGTTFPGTRRRFGDFDRWFLDALRGSGARFHVRDVTTAAPPRLSRYDGVLITGSPVSVYDGPGWLPELYPELRRAAARQRPPVLGICFGAQALATALGGQVVLNPRGWEIGTIRVQPTGVAMEDVLLGGNGEAEVAFQATHQDIIAALPDGAVTLASNRMSPVQAFRVGSCVWGVQFHPEATPAILEDLIRSRRSLLGGSFRRRLDGLSSTPAGREILLRFVRFCARHRDENAPVAMNAPGAPSQV